MVKSPKQQSTSIVLVGKFDPAIFQPMWFVNKGLLTEQEVKKAKVNLSEDYLISFELDWLHLEVVRERFIISTSANEEEETIRDLTTGIFSILTETPLSMIGINVESHFQLDNEDNYHSFGHKLAPKNIWNKFMKKPGLMALTIKDVRENGYKGYMRVKVATSLVVKPFGICIATNDHYEMPETEIKEGEDSKALPSGVDFFMKLLADEWNKSIEYSKTIMAKLIEEA